jgi:hypothetical protein
MRLSGEVQPLQKFAEAWISAQGIQAGIGFGENGPCCAFLARPFEPMKRLVSPA